MVLYQLREMQTKTYKELQALAKIHGVKANLSKSKLIDILTSTTDGGCSQDKLQDCNTNRPRDNLDEPHGGSDTPGTSEQLRDDSDQSRGDQIKDVPAVNSTQLGAEAEVLTESSERRRSERLSATPLGDQGEGVVPAVGASQVGTDASVAELLSSPAESVPEILPERRKSERLSATPRTNQGEGVVPAAGAVQLGVDTGVSAMPNTTGPEMLPGRRKSERPSGSKKEAGTAGKTSRTTKVKVSTALRFERMHQNLFAGQASIETYGKTPKKTPKRTAPAKENVPLTNATPVRPIELGPSVKSAKRGLTVASKPCTLVVQRSNKKPTQVKEFRLSSNKAGKREGFRFRPYSGPVRPLTPANKPRGFNVGASSPHDSRKQNHLAPKGVKATLASGRAQAARKNAHVQSSKIQRQLKIAEARVGHHA